MSESNDLESFPESDASPPPPRPRTVAPIAADDRPLPWLVARLAVWPFLEQIMGFLVGFVDTAMAGHLSVEATNAVGVGAYVLWFMGLLIGAMAVGASALIARSVGAGRTRRANQILGQATVGALAWGLALGGIFYFAAPMIASASGLREESRELCAQYLRILALAAPFSTILQILSACLRGAGDMRTAFLVMVGVNVVNIVVGLALVLPQSPFGGHGLAGIAMGTTAAWIAGCAAILAVAIFRRARGLFLQRRFVLPRRQVLARLIRIGLPSLLENAGVWFGNYLVIAIVGHLPSVAAMGAHIVTIRIEAISYLPGLAMGTAAATLAGQFLGAGDPKRARAAVLWCWLFGVSIMATMGFFFIFAPEPFVRLMTNQPELLEAAPRLLFITGFVQIGFATYLVLSSAMRGAGDTKTPMLISYPCTYLLRVPMAYIFSNTLGYGLNGVWVALGAELSIRGGLFAWRFLGGGWMRARV